MKERERARERDTERKMEKERDKERENEQEKRKIDREHFVPSNKSKSLFFFPILYTLVWFYTQLNHLQGGL